ncbi:MAG: S41 family peptidase [Gammaproteobacteria bacterium]
MRLCLGLLVLLASGQARTQECPSIAEYDEIVAVVTQRFFDQTFNGLNWAERVRHYRDRIDCAADADRVASTINSLLEELDASHTALYTRQDVHYWGLNSLFAEDGAYETDFSGIWPEREGGRWFVKHVLEGSPAAKVGVRVGDELLAIAGEEFSPLGFGPGVSTLGLSSDGRIVRTVSLETRRQSVMRGFVDAARASERIISVGSKRIGYFHLWTARDAILESMEAALERFENDRVDALVMDYRGGYGGTSEDYLTTLRESAFWRAVPKYFLIDDSVRSGKEMLTGIIKRDGLGILVGSKTAGYFLGASPFRFFDDKYLLLLAVGGGGALPGIGRIEGVGIEPDIVVEPCRRYCAGRDPILEKTIELIEAASSDA